MTRLVLAVVVLLVGAGPAWALPDLQLFRNGGVAENTSDDIGSSSAGTPRQVIYMIVNGGNTTLSLPAAAVTATSTVNAACSVAIQPNVVVTAGNSTLFTVQVTPAAGGAFSCAWAIASDDPDQPFTFVMAGTATGPAGQPQLVVENTADGTPFEDGDADRFPTFVGLALPRTYEVFNEGTAPLTIAVTIESGPNATCRLLNEPASPVTGSTLIVFEIEALSQGAATCTLRIASNDPMRPQVAIDVTNAPALELSYLDEPLPAGAEITLTAEDVRELPLAVRNLGNRTVTLVSVEPAVGDCLVLLGPPDKLLPGERAQVLVRAPAGDFTCVIALRSSDATVQAFTISGIAERTCEDGGCAAGGGAGWLVALLGALRTRSRRRAPRACPGCSDRLTGGSR